MFNLLFDVFVLDQRQRERNQLRDGMRNAFTRNAFTMSAESFQTWMAQCTPARQPMTTSIDHDAMEPMRHRREAYYQAMVERIDQHMALYANLNAEALSTQLRAYRFEEPAPSIDRPEVRVSYLGSDDQYHVLKNGDKHSLPSGGTVDMEIHTEEEGRYIIPVITISPPEEPIPVQREDVFAHRARPE